VMATVCHPAGWGGYRQTVAMTAMGVIWNQPFAALPRLIVMVLERANSSTAAVLGNMRLQKRNAEPAYHREGSPAEKPWFIVQNRERVRQVG
ncbi:MAG: hypothetical protein AAFV53_40420, partial [Myxococcota bacterium]